VLAHAGVGSRRACEEVILQGRVTVDGQIVRELGTRVDPARQKVAVDGQRIHAERMVYYAVSKPKGYVSTNHDPAGKPRVIDILPEIPERVYTVGRLDEQSTGLMLLTNDGALANCLAHPKYGVEKLYRVVVAGRPEREVLTKLTDGVWIAEGKVRAKRVRVAGTRGEATILEMTLAEGKNREVRRMLANLGHKVMLLTRVAVGPITLKGLSPGEYRSLTAVEVGLLRKVAAGIPVATPRSFDRDRPRPPKRGEARVQGPRAASGPGPRPTGGPSSGPRVAGGPPRTSSDSRPGSRVSGGPPPRPSHEPKGPRGPQRAPVRPAPPPRGRSGSGSGVDRRPAPAGPSGYRPILPSGLPPSQRPRPVRPSRPGYEPGPGAGSGSGDGSEPKRRIIGLDPPPAPAPGPGTGPPRPNRPGMRRPPPKHRPHPRAGLGPRRPRPGQGEDH
jgi:23S rRNA pseudouridine2605 synthase